MRQKKALIQVKNLGIRFGSKILFSHISFRINQGDFLCLLGPNGSGKTTLIKIILGNLEPDEGEVNFADRKIKRNIGYVPQFRNIGPDYPLSIKNFVALRFSHKLAPWLTKEEKKLLIQALKKTRLFPLRNQKIGLASGGEKQKAYLAQAILTNPSLIILDEPTASLDKKGKKETFQDVADLNRFTHTTIILISHDWQLVKVYGNKYLRLENRTYTKGLTKNLKANF